MKIERIPLVSISISSKIAQRRLKPDMVETFFLVFCAPLRVPPFKEPIETWFYTSLIRTFGARKSSYARPSTGKRNRERWQPISLYVRRAAKCVIVSGRSIWVHMCERSRVCESKGNPAGNEVVFFFSLSPIFSLAVIRSCLLTTQFCLRPRLDSSEKRSPPRFTVLIAEID